jgi:glycosyltransferase involved in cell wall biosynthesis
MMQADGALTVAISTMADRLGQVELPPMCPGIDYLVLVQGGPVGAYRARADLTLVELNTQGLSHSRNAALDLAQTEFVLFADDDVTLNRAGMLALVHAMRDEPDMDFAAGWRAERKPASPGRRAVGRFNAGRICAPELMVRRTAFRRAGVRFDPRFGLGAANGLGEEYVFVTDALKAGLRGVSLPIVTGSHPAQSTGENWRDPRLLAARQAMLARVFGIGAIAVRAGYAWRHRARLGSARMAWRFALGRA